MSTARTQMNEVPWDAKQAAEFLGVCDRTIKRSAARGELPGYFALGRWYFFESELREFLRSCKRGAGEF